MLQQWKAQKKEAYLKVKDQLKDLSATSQVQQEARAFSRNYLITSDRLITTPSPDLI
jgi:hypothetical protein